MTTIFWLPSGYNFGYVIASDTLFDFRGWVFGVKVSTRRLVMEGVLCGLPTECR